MVLTMVRSLWLVSNASLQPGVVLVECFLKSEFVGVVLMAYLGWNCFGGIVVME